MEPNPSVHHPKTANIPLSSLPPQPRPSSNESPQLSCYQIEKDVLSCPLTTPEFVSDNTNEFRLIIEDGITNDQTEDFLQYRQFYCYIWGGIVKIFRMLEKLMHKYIVPIALINGTKYAFFVDY